MYHVFCHSQYDTINCVFKQTWRKNLILILNIFVQILKIQVHRYMTINYWFNLERKLGTVSPNKHGN